MIDSKTINALFVGYRYAYDIKSIHLMETFEVSIQKALSVILNEKGFNGYPVCFQQIEFSSFFILSTCECGHNCLISFLYLGYEYEFCMMCLKLSNDFIGKGLQ